jgi:valyl-tRNA synthetase
MLHPFMPFITEEIWHLLRERKEGDDIIVASMPAAKPFDEKNLRAFEKAGQIILGIRNLRKEKNIPNKEPLALKVREGENADCKFYPVVSKLGNLSSIETVSEKPDGVIVFTVGSQEYYVPLGESVDVEAEIKKIEEELNYTRGFLNSVLKKLTNERFVNNAPAAVVEKERKKQADAEARIKVLEEQLKGLK